MIRSMLFIPGSTQKLLDKGPNSGADALIYDLEDAVSPDQKSQARTMVRDALLGFPQGDGAKPIQRIVRINSIDTEYWEDDLREIIKGKPEMIMLPKVSKASDVEVLIEKLEELEKEESGDLAESISRIQIIPLIETALGIENAYVIASSSERVTAMLLGGEDLTADLRCKRTKEGKEIFYARSRMVACGRAAGVEIYDTPFTDTRDEEGIKRDAETAKALGFTGKSAITPRHLPVINEIFSPSEEEIKYAEAVLEAIKEAEKEGRGVIALNGKMIDAPVVERARRVLEAARELEAAK